MGSISPNGIDVVLAGPVPTYRFTEFGYRKLFQMIQNTKLTSGLPAEAAITAPELFAPFEEADAASDVYMLGQVFYMLLSGGHPFAELDQDAALTAHLAHDLTPLHKLHTQIPKDLSLWIERLTNPDPLKRPRNAKLALEEMPAAKETPVVGHHGVAGNNASSKDGGRGPLVKGLVGSDTKPKKKKRMSPAVMYSTIGGVGVVAALALVLVIKGFASKREDMGAGNCCQ